MIDDKQAEDLMTGLRELGLNDDAMQTGLLALLEHLAAGEGMPEDPLTWCAREAQRYARREKRHQNKHAPFQLQVERIDKLVHLDPTQDRRAEARQELERVAPELIAEELGGEPLPRYRRARLRREGA